MKPTLISIIGPTAIGKTSMAIQLAKHFETEIVSCDSRQFYKEMSIGTAVPSPDELAAVKHHFIQHKHITDAYSVGDFEREMLEFTQVYFQKNAMLIMVGGSGLYEKAVTEGLDDLPKPPVEFRKALEAELAKNGLEPLQNELKTKDPNYYQEVDLQNPHRIIRALEVIRFTHQPFSSFRTQSKKNRPFDVIKIGLTLPREQIYANINARVHMMIEAGLVDEVKSLYKYKDYNALQTVGYKEIFAYLDGKFTLDEAIAEIQKNTRRYAKRQLTWYRKQEDITWFHPSHANGVIRWLENKIGN